MVRLACANVSLSVALTAPPAVARGLVLVRPDGGVTVTVLERVPVAEDLMVATTVYVTEPPGGMVTMSSILPEPDGVNPVAPPEPEPVQVSELREWMTDHRVVDLGPGDGTRTGVGGHDGVGDLGPRGRRTDGGGDRGAPVVVGLGDGQVGLSRRARRYRRP